MLSMKDYYKTLEVNPSSTDEEIKKSYRRLALKYHPDRNLNSRFSEDIFKEIVEAYQVLTNIESKNKYDYSRSQQTQKSKEKQDQDKEKQLTAKDVLAHFTTIQIQVTRLKQSEVNQENLFKNLDELLTNNIINFLLFFDDIKTNKLIINEILICSKYLNYKNANVLINKAAKIAGSDNDMLLAIFKFDKRLKLWAYWGFYKYIIIPSIIIGIFVIAVNSENRYTPKLSPTPDNGELNNTFVDSNLSKTQVPLEKSVEEKLKENGWEEMNLNNGQLPSCYNFKPKKGKLNNYLDVNVGGGTDISIKVMNVQSQKCVRYVYISGGSSFKIKNIPAGVYYLKIAYGKQWFSRIENGKCIGKFIKNPLYEKGTDILDFNIKYYGNKYSIPSFSLSLDVITNNSSNSFNSNDISEDEFNL